MWIEDIRVWLNAGLNKNEIESRLQARVPGFDISPQPGGRWDWLLGVIAVGLASTALVLLSRRVVARRSEALAELAARESEEPEQEWQDRLDDELLDAEA